MHVHTCMDLAHTLIHTHTAHSAMLFGAERCKLSETRPYGVHACTDLVHVAIVMGTLSLSSRSRGSGWKKLYMSL